MRWLRLWWAWHVAAQDCMGMSAQGGEREAVLLKVAQTAELYQTYRAGALELALALDALSAVDPHWREVV